MQGICLFQKQLTIKIYDQILGLGLCQHTRQIIFLIEAVVIPGLRKLALAMEIGIDYGRTSCESFIYDKDI